MTCVLRAMAECKKGAKIFADSFANFGHAELFVAKGCPKSGK